MLESCSIFDELSPKGRLAVILRKQPCQFCFRHHDNQHCPSHSQPACSIRGCMRMHHELLHDGLQEEEVRALVTEVDPEASEEEDEYYAADFEDDYEQGNSEGYQKEKPETDTQSPTSSEDGAPSHCQ
jgi:hypothetical protein